jgi:hypothetical protein
VVVEPQFPPVSLSHVQAHTTCTPNKNGTDSKTLTKTNTKDKTKRNQHKMKPEERKEEANE